MSTALDRVREYFELEAHDTDVSTEVLAGVTTFLTMSYIVVVNPGILAGMRASAEGGPKPGIIVPGYSFVEVQQMLAVVTILSAAAAIFVMAFYANRPFALAPGLGLNAFVAFTVIGALGVPWETALAAVVVEGVLFVLLTLIGAREYVIRLFPEPVKLAVGTGIGLFLALIGLYEMGVVVKDPGVLITIGPIASDPVAGLAVLGLLFTLMLYARGIPGAIVVGIVATTVVGWLVEVAGLVPAGTLTQSFAPPQYDISPLAGAFVAGFSQVELTSFVLVVFTLFFVDFSDTAGTLLGVSQIAGFLDEDGNLPDIDEPLMADAIGTVVGGMLGTTTVTTYIESATGVEEGGRTGLTALTVGVLFLVALVFVPVAAAVPLYASHIALVMVGLIMLKNVVNVDWDDASEAIPAGMTAIVMPMTFSIAYGIAAGIVTYPIVKAAKGDFADVRAGHWALALAFVVYFVVRTSGMLQGAI